MLEDAARKTGLRDGLTYRCADYAILGARVLEKLTKHPYTAAAAESAVPFTRRDDSLFWRNWSDAIEPVPAEFRRNMGAGKLVYGSIGDCEIGFAQGVSIVDPETASRS